MTTKVVPGMLIAVESASEAGVEAAARMARVVRRRLGDAPRARIALSGGSTPRAAYAELARAAGIDWSRVDVFFVDERAVAPTDERSNFRMVRDALLVPAPVPTDNVFRMAAESADLASAASAYHDLIDRRVSIEDGVPAFDLVVLGIGTDGHTASLFPGDATLTVRDRWCAAVDAAPGREARLTLTLPVLERARNAVVLAVGREKHAPLERTWQVAGALEATPARVVRNMRGTVVWVIDRAAGGLGP